jgi:hypothetical protein
MQDVVGPALPRLYRTIPSMARTGLVKLVGFVTPTMSYIDTSLVCYTARLMLRNFPSLEVGVYFSHSFTYVPEVAE